jgi:hypothetical protein
MIPAFPIILLDISLVLAVTTSILLITSEILSPFYGASNLKLNKRKLKNTAYVASMIFLATVAVIIATKIYGF